eukprot:6205225-Pleurochrysis_carterae.AAC.1
MDSLYQLHALSASRGHGVQQSIAHNRNAVPQVPRARQLASFSAAAGLHSRPLILSSFWPWPLLCRARVQFRRRAKAISSCAMVRMAWTPRQVKCTHAVASRRAGATERRRRSRSAFRRAVRAMA